MKDKGHPPDSLPDSLLCTLRRLSFRDRLDKPKSRAGIATGLPMKDDAVGLEVMTFGLSLIPVRLLDRERLKMSLSEIDEEADDARR